MPNDVSPSGFDVILLRSEAVKVRFENDQLNIWVDDNLYSNVQVYRVNPLSDPDNYWAFVDSESNEIGVISDCSNLDPTSKATANFELRKRYFVPKVVKVISVTEDYGSIFWEVETDRGNKKYHVRGLKDNMVELGGNKLMITDVDGNRFEVPNTSILDKKSMEIVMRSL